MKILVTGGLGFIGSHLVDKLVMSGHDVDVIDAQKTGSNVAFSNAKARYYNIDLGIDESKIAELFRSNAYEQVFHLAAESHVDRAIKDANPFIRSNINGTYNLFKVLSAMKTAPKVLLFSTDEVMGELENGTFSEKDPTAPKNMYSMTKLAQEGIARSYFHSDGVQVITTRCSNVYGPRQHKEKFLPVILNSIYNNRAIPLYGDGKNVREWTYVEDAVDAAIFTMKSFQPNDIVHIGSGIEQTNLDVVKTVIKKLEKSEDLISFVGDRKGHDKRYALDVSKINKKGWRAKYNFDRGLDLTIKWFKEYSQR